MNRWRLLFSIAFFHLLLFASSGSAQPQTGSGYVGGAEPCMRCHPKQFESFAATKMGTVLLKGPRNEKEALACEACHGPAAAHVASAGAQRSSGFVSFTKRDPTSIGQRNAVCLQCHTKGAVALWDGSQHDSRKLACVDWEARPRDDIDTASVGLEAGLIPPLRRIWALPVPTG